jgi:hypothetical protein
MRTTISHWMWVVAVNELYQLSTVSVFFSMILLHKNSLRRPYCQESVMILATAPNVSLATVINSILLAFPSYTNVTANYFGKISFTIVITG